MMYRKGSDYMSILKQAAKHLDSRGQDPSPLALASAHHKAHGEDIMLTASVIAAAMEIEILKAQMKAMLQRNDQIAERVDSIDILGEKMNALVIGSDTYDDLRKMVMSTRPSLFYAPTDTDSLVLQVDTTSAQALYRVPLAVKFAKQYPLEDLD